MKSINRRIVVPLKSELILELLKGKKIIFNDLVEIRPEVIGIEEKYDLLYKIQSSISPYSNDPSLLIDEVKKAMDISEEEVHIFRETSAIYPKDRK